MYSGLFFVSSYILAMYSDIIHIETNCTPAKKVIATIRDVHPAVKSFHANIYDKIAYIKIIIVDFAINFNFCNF